MKKLIFLLAFALTVSATFAQSTKPRWGGGPNDDNTYRAMNLKYQTVTDAAGADSVVLRPGTFTHVVRVALTDSFTFKQPVVTGSYAADNLVIIASGASGNKVKFTGSNFITAGTATLSSGGRAVIRLIFDGSKWVEAARVVQ
jgi:hypothetical protein